MSDVQAPITSYGFDYDMSHRCNMPPLPRTLAGVAYYLPVDGAQPAVHQPTSSLRIRATTGSILAPDVLLSSPSMFASFTSIDP